MPFYVCSHLFLQIHLRLLLLERVDNTNGIIITLRHSKKVSILIVNPFSCNISKAFYLRFQAVCVNVFHNFISFSIPQSSLYLSKRQLPSDCKVALFLNSPTDFPTM